MKLRKVFLLLAISGLIFLGGCQAPPFSDRERTIYEKIHKQYTHLSSYSASLLLTVYSNKTEHTYRVEQKVLGNDKFYSDIKSEESGVRLTVITNGAKTKTLSEGTGFSEILPTERENGVFYLTDFFRRYYGSEETSVTANAKQGGETVLETQYYIDGFAYHKARLTIDNKTLSPETLILYDNKNKPILSATYTAFYPNDKTVEEALFAIN